MSDTISALDFIAVMKEAQREGLFVSSGVSAQSIEREHTTSREVTERETPKKAEELEAVKKWQEKNRREREKLQEKQKEREAKERQKSLF